MSNLGKEPAVPIEKIQANVNDTGVSKLVPYLGMSKRFYAACAAMQGIMANYELLQAYIKGSGANGKSHLSFVAEYAYEAADELLKQEQDEER